MTIDPDNSFVIGSPLELTWGENKPTLEQNFLITIPILKVLGTQIQIDPAAEGAVLCIEAI